MSRRRGRPSRMQAALLLACLVMGWLLQRELSTELRVTASAFSVTPTSPAASPAVSSPDVPEGAAGTAFAVDPIERFEAVVARTMFSPTRRPPAAAPAEVVRSTPALTGIIGSPEGPMALLGMAGSQPVRVRVGEVVDGWTVIEIGDDQVVLGRGRETATIALAWHRASATERREPADAPPRTKPASPEPPPPAAAPVPGMLP